MISVPFDLSKIPPAERRVLDQEALRQGVPTIELVKRAALEMARKVVGTPVDRR